jgi:hypothetical protein
MNTFKTLVQSSREDGEPEYTNASFNFDNGVVLSVGFGSSHYTSPKGFQGVEPNRTVVEIAVLRDGNFVTRDFYSQTFDRVLSDDVVSFETSEFFSLLRLVEVYSANSFTTAGSQDDADDDEDADEESIRTGDRWGKWEEWQQQQQQRNSSEKDWGEIRQERTMQGILDERKKEG